MKIGLVADVVAQVVHIFRGVRVATHIIKGLVQLFTNSNYIHQ